MALELDRESALSLGTIILYLEGWYAEHVLGTDQRYKPFFSIRTAEGAKVVSVESNEEVAG
jgi:hypothetical protein